MNRYFLLEHVWRIKDWPRKSQ